MHAEQRIRLAGLDVSFWAPDSSGESSQYADQAKAPIVVFSHGWSGCATQSGFLMQALARAGYAVFAPNHDDAQCGHAVAVAHATEAQALLEKPETWSAESYHNRARDLADVVKTIEASPEYAQQYDVTRIALIGHSLGGMSVLSVAGARGNWALHDRAIKAVVALAPFAKPLLLNGSLDKVFVPVMVQTGARDGAMMIAVDKKDGVYDRLPAPKYEVVFSEAAHFAWSDSGDPQTHEGIAAYTVAFLDHYVKGEPATARLTDEDQGVATVRFSSELGEKDDGLRAAEPKVKQQSVMSSPNGLGSDTIRQSDGMERGGILGGIF